MVNQTLKQRNAGFVAATTIRDVSGNDAISFEQFVRNSKGVWLQ